MLAVRSGHTQPNDNVVPKWWRDYVAEIGPVVSQHIARRICADLAIKCAEDRRVVWEVHRAVRAAVSCFVAARTRDAWADADTAAIFRRLGRKTALAGLAHDEMHAAYRAAAAVFIRVVLVRGDLKAGQDITELTQGVHEFLSQLTDASSLGHAEGTAMAAGDRKTGPDMLSVVLGPTSTARRIATIAERSSWTVPATIMVAELDPTRLDSAPDVRVPSSAGALIGELLGRRYIVFPGELGRDAVREILADAARTSLIVVSPVVPLADGQQAIKINKRMFSHGHSAGLASGVLFCQDHIVDLLVEYARPPLDMLGAALLSPLQGLSLPKRVRYGRLLSAWLEHGTVRADEPGVLDRKRQTLRYQCERLEQFFGPALHDRDTRVALMLALRITLPHWQRELARVEAGEDPVGFGDVDPFEWENGWQS